MKKHTIAFANNFQHIATRVGRMPTPELCAFLKREGVVTDKVALFRPAKVNAAIRFLLRNNVVFAKEWGHRTFEPFDESVAVHRIPAEDMIDLSEEEASAIESHLENSDSMASADSNIVLYVTEHAPLNREEHIVENLKGASPKKGKAKLEVPRHPKGLVHPNTDLRFYEKCFPRCAMFCMDAALTHTDCLLFHAACTRTATGGRTTSTV
jgi:hypothetical protein